jgi:hypothetical protein
MNKPEKKKSHIPLDGEPVDALIILLLKGFQRSLMYLTS